MKTISLVLVALILAPLAAAQQPSQDDASAAEAERRERAIERCEASRGVDCATDEGLAEWLATESWPSRAAEEARRRERAIERCEAARGVDCVTDAGLAEWLLQERSRSDAEAEGSRSIYQTAPRATQRPAN